MFDFLQVIRVF